MSVDTPELLLLTILLLVPGALGDIFMRSVTDLPPHRTQFGTVLSAAAWSWSALILVEAVGLLFSNDAGSSVLAPIRGLAAGDGLETQYIYWYAFYVVSAVFLPASIRWGWVRFTLKMKNFRTPTAASFDVFWRKLAESSGQPEGTDPEFVKVRTITGKNLKGWVRYRTTGREKGALVLKDPLNDDHMWIPGDSIEYIKAVGPDEVEGKRQERELARPEDAEGGDTDSP